MSGERSGVTRSKCLTRRWRGQDAEVRRTARRASLIEAGLEIMGTEGASATTMRATCRRAKLTERYFYESFEDREALLVAVLEHVVLGARDVLLSSMVQAPEDPSARIRYAVKAFTDYVASDPRRGRVMLVESQSEPALARRGDELIAEFTNPMAVVLRMLRIERVRHPGWHELRPADVELSALTLFGAMAFLYQRWLAGALRISKRRLVEHVVRSIEAQALLTHPEAILSPRDEGSSSRGDASVRART